MPRWQFAYPTNLKKQKQSKPHQTRRPKNNTIFVSHFSYNCLIGHFANAISILEQDSHYNPNENELKVSALQAKLEALKAVNMAVSLSYMQSSNVMINRSKMMNLLQKGKKQMQQHHYNTQEENSGSTGQSPTCVCCAAESNRQMSGCNTGLHSRI